MRKFSEELGRLIREREIAVYELAKASGVDRTLIHKMVKGERVPAQQSAVEKLAGALMLSSDEREMLLGSYRAAKMGEKVYRSRKAVFDFYNRFPPSASSGFAREGVVPSVLPRETVARGKTDVGSLVWAVLEEEAAKPDGRVAILAQPECSLPFEILAVVAARRQNLVVDHVMRFENSVRDRDPLYNLRCLSTVMPMFASGCLYRPQYYYDPAAAQTDGAELLPYVIVTGRSVVRLSRNAECATATREPSFLALYRSLFDGLQARAVPLAEVFRTPIEQIHYVNRMNDRFESMNCDFAAQPCLLLFAGQSMVRRYINPAFLKSPQDADMILKYMDSSEFAERLQDLTRVYFSAEGIEEFLATGRLHELPDYYYSPLDVPDRYLLLRRMYEAILAGRYHAFLVNQKKLRIPSNLGTYFFQNGGVGFVYVGTEQQYTAISVGETSIVKAIQDFLAYLPESGLVATEREMMEFLRAELADPPR